MAKKKETHGFASRGGVKLQAALGEFGLSVEGKICADAGCSTGGFTDVLLRSGAAKVFAIDTAYGELAWTLRNDPRVVVLERTNVRKLESLEEPAEVVTVDISLISALKILPSIKGWLASHADLVVLIKPQYEALKEELPRGAIITDPNTHRNILSRTLQSLKEELELHPVALISSPITGSGGNKEFLVHLSNTAPAKECDIAEAIKIVLS